FGQTQNMIAQMNMNTMWKNNSLQNENLLNNPNYQIQQLLQTMQYSSSITNIPNDLPCKFISNNLCFTNAYVIHSLDSAVSPIISSSIKQIVKICSSKRSQLMIATAKNYEDSHKLRNTQAFRGLENGDQNRVQVEKDV
ncbi:29343_t:CDS:2, partial [Racocetra persica]